MLTKFMKKIISLPVLAHIALAVITMSWFQWAKGKLDASYAASLHPVDYLTGQTRFSGEMIKGYYATMSDAGTLKVYVTTQLIDFGFILGFLGIGLFVCTLIARHDRKRLVLCHAGEPKHLRRLAGNPLLYFRGFEIRTDHIRTGTITG